jgi:CBS domain-containing protein
MKISGFTRIMALIGCQEKTMSMIRDILDHKGNTVKTVTSQVSVLDAISNMSEANIGAVVIQDGDQPIGIFTERDYLRKIALKGRSSQETEVSEVMSSPLITVESSEVTRNAMGIMTERRCRHLVVTENEKMVGIVSLGDLVKHMLLEKEAEVEQLSSYIKGSY